MADLLLLSARPTRNPDGQWKVPLLDGAVSWVNPYQWKLTVAQALHHNVVRAPLYAVRDWLALTPTYLSDYFERGVAVGVLDGEEVLPLEENQEQSFRLSWNKDEGLSLRRIEEAKTHFAQKDKTDGWKDFEESWELD